MDKFTVDIEKVLDEFEYNEGREESIVPAVIKNHSLSHISQKQFKTPASNYRRPAFEPINLSDADFAAAPISNTQNYTSLSKQNNFLKEAYKNTNNNVGVESTENLVSHSSKFNNQNDINNENLSANNSLNSNTDDSCTSNKISIQIEPQCSDGTPDLLDSNTLKPVQNNVNFNEEQSELHNQLPDITSVRNTSLVPVEESGNQPVFDLINTNSQSHSQSNTNYQDELPPIIDVGTITKENIPELKIKPISFDSADNIPESELEEYLQTLEELESSAEEQSIQEPVEVLQPYETNVEQKLELHCEKTEINEVETAAKPLEDVSASQQNETSPSETDESSVEVSESEKEETKDVTVIEVKEVTSAVISENEVQVSEIVTEPEEQLAANISIDKDNANSEKEDENKLSSYTSELNCDSIESVETENFSKNSTENYTVESPDESRVSFNQSEVDEHVYNEQSVEISVTDIEEQDDAIVAENQVNENIENVEKSASQENAIDSSTASIESFPEEQIENGHSQFVTEDRPSRPSTLPLESNLVLDSEESPTPTNIPGVNSTGVGSPMDKLGKVPPFWVPDTESDSCMQCRTKFTVIRRRHHCRACGLVLCSKCCNLKAPLEYLEFTEARVCQPCFNIIYRVSLDDGRYNLGRQPNPNNPMEYCSTIPPLQQAASTMNQPPPSVLVPTGVLKREGRAKSDVPKQVMFSDGIRPGGDLTELDGPSQLRIVHRLKGTFKPNQQGRKGASSTVAKRPLDPTTQSYIPNDSTQLPPVVTIENGQLLFIEDVREVTDQTVKFAINNNLFVNIKKVKLECCVNRECWSVSSEGLAYVGQDEVAIVIEVLKDELLPPIDIFHLINTLFLEASKGTTVSEMCFTPAFSNNMLGSKDHGGFLYIRPTFQCTTNLLLPPQPYLIAILVHKWETPWARLFPLRLVLRLGAEYRYYPSPLVSIRDRPPLYTEIGHTVMKLLVDFRKYSYSLATVRGLLIHMEDRLTTILFPRNRYDQVVRALDNSNDSVLAFGANLSLKADSHLVCIQGTKDEKTYNTQAINIHTKPRRVTGASFVVFNGALKTAGLSGKSSIVEDGLMVHLPSDSMANLRTALRDMKDYTISCGPNDEETVLLQWTSDNTNFNIGVKSYIDGKPFDGIPSIRVHNGTDYPGPTKIIRWTEVFILKSEEGNKATDPLDISRVSESIATATCMALVPMLDSLVSANLTPLAIRATIHPENVGYEAGSCGTKLPSIYMNRLDEELISVLHEAAMSSQDTPAVLELIFRIMNHP